MALPPIISNFPSLNLFKSDQTKSDQVKTAQAETGQPSTSSSSSSSSQANAEDLVEISSAALSRLQGDQQVSKENQLNELARETGDILNDESLSLGLDPEFSV